VKIFSALHTGGETSATPLKKEALPCHWLVGSGWLRDRLPLIARLAFNNGKSAW